MIEEKLETIRDSINEVKTNLGLETTDSLETLVETSENAVIPSGTLSITENGVVDVKEYENVDVNVSGGDLSEYFEVEPTTFEGEFRYWLRTFYAKKFPPITIPDNITTLTKIYSYWELGVIPPLIFHNNVTDLSNMFTDINGTLMGSKLKILDVSGWDISNVTNITNLFGYAEKLETIIGMNVLNPAKITSVVGMFRYCSRLQNNGYDLSAFDMSKITNFQSMFERCSNLTTIDVSNWDMSNATDISNMFRDCSGLTTIDVSNWNTQNVTNMSGLFNGCSLLTQINVSSFITSKITNMGSIFANCSGLTTIDVSNWNISKTNNIASMFANCSGLTSIDLSNFKNPSTGSPIINVSSLFSGCTNLVHVDLRGIDFTPMSNSGYHGNMFGTTKETTFVPANCEIIVADDTQKAWINEKFPRMTNVKTVAEYEAE